MMEEFILNLSDFQVLDIINEGQFGKVLRIQDRRNGNKYAAKVNKNKCTETQEQINFTREIRALSSVKYPTIVPFKGFNLLDFESEPHPTLVMKYVSNGSLREMLDNEIRGNAPIEWTDTSKYIILLGIALGMNYLHSKGIIHRDLKPNNILLDEHFYPLLCDFGFSKMTTEQLSCFLMSSNLGTPFYMAPEIIAGDQYTSSVDVYAFGKIAYELITSKQSPIDLSNIKDDDNKDFFRNCLSNDPAKRPTFKKICEFITKKCFINLFNNIDMNEIYYFFDNYEDELDNEAFCVRGYLAYLENKEEASRYFKKSADDGNDEAMSCYAKMLEYGDGIPVNKNEAIQYYKRAIEKENASAMTSYGYMIMCGKADINVMEEGIRLILRAIEKGDSGAMCIYGCYLFYIKGDDTNAAHYIKMSADNGYVEGMFRYGNMLYTGQGVQANYEEGFHYILKAAKNGNIEALKMLIGGLKNIKKSETNPEKINFVDSILNQLSIYI